MISSTMEMMYKYIKAYPPTHNDAYSDPDPCIYPSFTYQLSVVLPHYNTASKTVPESQKLRGHVSELCF